MDEKYADGDFEKQVEEDGSDDDSTASTAESSSDSEYTTKVEDDGESIASEESQGDIESDDEAETKIFKKSADKPKNNPDYMEESGDDSSDDDDDDENYLQKFDETLKQNVISDHHPEMHQHNYDEIESLCLIIRDYHGNIIDPLHKTVPFLTKYEKARILGERAKQINAGAKPFVKVENNVIDGYLIALSELEQKMIPFIVKRPMPNGGCEYWRLRDLEIL